MATHGDQHGVRRIDLHAHHFPVDVWGRLAKLYPNDYQLERRNDGAVLVGYMKSLMPAWSPQSRLDEMNRTGVALEVLSLPFVYSKLDEHSPEICARLNEAYAAMRDGAPTRFRAFAHLPFNDMDETLRELARCVDRLDVAGVAVTSNIGGRYLDEPEFEPFWREVDRLRIPVFMHPIESPCYGDIFRAAILSFPFDTTLAVSRLVCSGLYDRHPDIVLIAAHLGGALPFLAYRLDAGLSQAHDHGWTITGRPSEHLKKVYLDTATVWDQAAFGCACGLVGVDRLVFGSDSFAEGPQFRRKMIDFLEGMDLSEADLEKIYHVNIERVWATAAARRPLAC